MVATLSTASRRHLSTHASFLPGRDAACTHCLDGCAECSCRSLGDDKRKAPARHSWSFAECSSVRTREVRPVLETAAQCDFRDRSTTGWLLKKLTSTMQTTAPNESRRRAPRQCGD